jgi:hypothetical protein
VWIQAMDLKRQGNNTKHNLQVITIETLKHYTWIIYFFQNILKCLYNLVGHGIWCLETILDVIYNIIEEMCKCKQGGWSAKLTRFVSHYNRFVTLYVKLLIFFQGIQRASNSNGHGSTSD